MAIYLKSNADIAALIADPDYAAIATARKGLIAAHFEEMPANVWQSALDILLTSYSADEQNFARALFTNSPPAGGSAQPPSTPVSSAGDERRGLLPIASGASQVAIPFNPAYSAVPLPPSCEVVKASPGDDDITVMDVENLTVNGCVALLSAAPGNDNYHLSFRAVSLS